MLFHGSPKSQMDSDFTILAGRKILETDRAKFNKGIDSINASHKPPSNNFLEGHVVILMNITQVAVK